MTKKSNNRIGITLDELANMVARGFESTSSEIKELGTELKGDINALAKKVDKLDYQMDEVYDILKRFEENDILNLQKRVQILEKAVRALATSQSSK